MDQPLRNAFSWSTVSACLHHPFASVYIHNMCVYMRVCACVWVCMHVCACVWVCMGVCVCVGNWSKYGSRFLHPTTPPRAFLSLLVFPVPPFFLPLSARAGMMRKDHPGVVLSVKTHQAIRSVLNHGRDNIRHLLETGLLDETDAEKLFQVRGQWGGCRMRYGMPFMGRECQ